MQNKLQLSLILLLIIMAILTTWLITTSGNIVLPESKPQNPDSLMTLVDAIKFSKTGQPHHIFKSAQLVNYLKNNMTKLKQPFYVFQNETESPWHICADRGKAYNGIDRIILNGHIKIQQLPGKNSRNLTLITDQMTFYPNRSFAETDRPVTIKQPGIIIHGIGLEVDLKTGNVKLRKTQGEHQKI
jgi:lipopolysaccharide export system protein LptC